MKDEAEEAGLLEQLAREPWAFDFFQAVRRLEGYYRDLPRLGYSKRPDQDPVRFGQEPSLRFPSSTLDGYRGESRGQAARLSVNFIGLLGPNGPMPLAFADYVRSRRARGDRAWARFLDVFNHRIVSLFYRAWSQHQRAVGFDRPAEDRWAVYLGSLFGIGMEAFRHRDAVNDVAKLHFTGHLACQTRHADGLAAILSSYFGVPAAIEPFKGQWINLPADSLCFLGRSREAGTLGVNLLVGSRTWDCQQRFTIRLGPMDFADYARLLPEDPRRALARRGGDAASVQQLGADPAKVPTGAALRRLTAWVRNYVGFELSWEVQLVLKPGQVAGTRLGKVGHLGWSSWLVTSPPAEPRGDLVLSPGDGGE